MRIAIFWSDISGYMSACWRALAAEPGVQLKIWAFAPKARNNQAPFDPKQLSHGVDVVFLDQTDRHDESLWINQVSAFRPDAMLVCGWLCPAYTRLVTRVEFTHTFKIMGIDLPWRGTARQRIACVVKRPYVRRFNKVWAAGERACQYASRILGDDAKVCRGVYAYDATLFDPVARTRLTDSEAWPRRFLYVGRYAPEKGMDTLVEAYRRYRDMIDDPWELHCCGAGPLAHLLQNQPGVTDHGFTQPADLPARFADCGVFVIASRYEPWGVVIAEAMGSGLPVICSSACGAAVELVHQLFNGWVVPAGRPEEFAKALHSVHRSQTDLLSMAQHAHTTVAAYTAGLWAKRLLNMIPPLDQG